MTGSTALNAARRASELAALADGEPLDVIVIGGGITGVGIALDAATRGLTSRWWRNTTWPSVPAGGVPSWSTAVCDTSRPATSASPGAARIERGILMTRNAPHLVKAMPQLVPLLPVDEQCVAGAGPLRLRRRRWAAQARGHAGVDAAAVPADRRHRAIELTPTVRRDGFAGGLLAYDGQLIDDARLVTAVARTAAQHGARFSPVSRRRMRRAPR